VTSWLETGKSPTFFYSVVLIADLVEVVPLPFQPMDFQHALTAPPAATADRPKDVRAARRDAEHLPQETEEQRLLQLPVPIQASQRAPHSALGSGYMGQAGTGRPPGQTPSQPTLQRKPHLCTLFLFWELRGLSPNFHIHVSVSGLNIPRIGPHIFLHQNRQTDPGNI
jgi:hypothetical protein